MLFVAHREEILSQAMHTFRRIRPEASLGCFTGKEKRPEADVLFASIQTLGRKNHLRKFQPTSSTTLWSTSSTMRRQNRTAD